jgi:hypothetical protein
VFDHSTTFFELLPVSVDDVSVAGDAAGIDWLAEAIDVDHDGHLSASTQHSTRKA